METKNQNASVFGKAISLVATMALACSLLPLGALTAFGENETILQALNLVQDNEGVVAEEASSQQGTPALDETDGSGESVDQDAPEQGSGSVISADDEKDGDQGKTNAQEVAKSEAAQSTEAKAFANAYKDVVAASEAGDADALKTALETAEGLYAMLTDDEKAQESTQQMWEQIKSARAAMPADEVTDPEASIGETGYETLQAAVNAAAAGETVVLNKDVTLSTPLSLSGNITLDLGGMRLTESEAGVIVVNGGDVSITHGSISLTSGSGSYILNVTGGSLVTSDITLLGYGASGVNVTGGSYTAASGTIQCESGYGIRVTDGATASMENGLIIATNGVFIANGGSTFNMNGGNISASQYGIVGNGLAQNGGTTINVRGGSISSSGWIAIYHPQAGTLNVSGGSLTGNYGGIGIKAGTLNVTGGTITGTNGQGYVDCASRGDGITVWGSAIHVDSHAGYSGSIAINISAGTLNSANGYAIHEVSDGASHVSAINVTGGSFNAALDVFKLEAASADVVSVSGGRFTHAVPAEYCAAGYVCDGANGSYEMVAADSIVEARIGDVTYKTLQEAIEAAANGDTVVLLRSIGVTGTGVDVTGKAITLDLNGNTITGTSLSSGYGAINSNTGASLTILGNGGGVNADGVAVYVYHGNVTVNGGTYKGNSAGCLYTEYGDITVFGGHFSCDEYNGKWFVLNKKDSNKDQCTITVYGGTFVNCNPAANNNEEPAEKQTVDGTSVEAKGNSFEVVRSYGGNVALMDGTLVDGNEIVFADESTLQLVEGEENEWGEVSHDWQIGFRVNAPLGAHNASYAIINDAFKDDGSSTEWVNAGAVSENGEYFISTSQGQMDTYKGSDNQLMYRYAFDWDGDGNADQYVTVILRDTVRFADHVNHVWEEGVVIQEPGCVNDGIQEFVCSVGHEVEYRAVPALGHLFLVEDQYLEGDEDPYLYGWQYADATCTTPAYRDRFCMREYCDSDGEDQSYYQYEELSPALGHDWSDWEDVNPATCTEEGLRQHACKRADCFDYSNEAYGWGFEDEIIPAKGHSYDSGVVTKAATCTDDGVMTFTCSVCKNQSTEVIPATGHVEAADLAVAATCTASGLTAGSHCSTCGEVLTAQQVIPVLGHDWDEGTVTQAATCSAPGVLTHSCSRCDATSTEAIAMTAHREGSVVTAVATCTQAGTATISCLDCGAQIRTESIPALGHAVVNDAAVAATCEATGLSAGTHCATCGDVLTAQQTVPALGHAWGAWTVTKAAEVGVEGSEERACAHDATHVETRVVAALTEAQTPSGADDNGDASLVATGTPATVSTPASNPIVETARTVLRAGGVTQAIADDQTPLASGAEVIDDEATPLASFDGSSVTQSSNDSIDWLPIAIAIAAFVIIDGVALGLLLLRRRRIKSGQ